MRQKGKRTSSWPIYGLLRHLKLLLSQAGGAQPGLAPQSATARGRPRNRQWGPQWHLGPCQEPWTQSQSLGLNCLCVKTGSS